YRDAEPVPGSDVEAEPGGHEQRHRAEVQEPRGPEGAALAEAGGDRLQPLLAVDLEVEQRVEAVEAGDPECNRAAEGAGLPRDSPRDRGPRADGREPVHRAEPEVAEPRP